MSDVFAEAGDTAQNKRGKRGKKQGPRMKAFRKLYEELKESHAALFTEDLIERANRAIAEGTMYGLMDVIYMGICHAQEDERKRLMRRLDKASEKPIKKPEKNKDGSVMTAADLKAKKQSRRAAKRAGAEKAETDVIEDDEDENDED